MHCNAHIFKFSTLKISTLGGYEKRTKNEPCINRLRLLSLWKESYSTSKNFQLLTTIIELAMMTNNGGTRTLTLYAL